MALADDKARVDGLRQYRLQVLLRLLVDNREDRNIGGGAEAGEVFQSVPGRVGKPTKLLGHQVDDVVAVALGPNASEVRNCTVKKGLPAVFSCSNRASGRATCGSQ